jgi:hypothetical protein
MKGKDFFARVSSNEVVARFVVHARWIRSSSLSVKPEAFMPHPPTELSVTRERDLAEVDLWRVGESIAAKPSGTLYGRASLGVEIIRTYGLDAKPDPVSENMNHALVIGWPAEKSAQKSHAQLLAAASRYIARPQEGVINGEVPSSELSG